MFDTHVHEALEAAPKKADLSQVREKQQPRLLSGNGPCHLSGELKRFLERKRTERTRGPSYHLMAQRKTER